MKTKYLLTTTWAVIIMVVCLLPQDDIPRNRFLNIPHMDKIVHFGMFSVLAFLIYREHRSYTATLRTILTLFIVCVLYGLTTEILQFALTADRHFEWLDWLTDGTGSLTGLWVSFQVHTRYLHK